MNQKKPSLLFPLLFVCYEVINYLSNDMYLPALPQMMDDLNLSTKQAQLTLTTWFLGQASLPLVMGVISDNLGRRKVLLVGGIGYILATIACALAPHGYALLIARAIEGGMVASMLVPGYASIHEGYDQKDAVRILAIMGSISVLAPAFGPLVGSMVLYFTHWRGIFWIIALAATINLLLLAKWMPETLPVEKRHSLHLGQLFKNYWRVLTNKKFLLFVLTVGFVFAGFLAWVSAGPLLIMNSFHYSAMAFGWIQAGIFAAYILGNYLVKSLLDKIGIHNLVYLGLGTALLGGLSCLMVAIAFPLHLFPFLAALILYSLGAGLCFSSLSRLTIETSDEPMGIKVSLFTVFVTSFAVIGSATASLFFNGSIISLASLLAGAITISFILKVVSR